jgi:UDP-N-acetylmuramate dehydrogenase
MADINKIKDALGDIAVGKILYDEPMSRYASLLVGGKADALVFIENGDQLIQIVRRLKEKKIDFLPVGNMTNIIVRDGGYHGVILLGSGRSCTGFSTQPRTGGRADGNGILCRYSRKHRWSCKNERGCLWKRN